MPVAFGSGNRDDDFPIRLPPGTASGFCNGTVRINIVPVPEIGYFAYLCVFRKTYPEYGCGEFSLPSVPNEAATGIP